MFVSLFIVVVVVFVLGVLFLNSYVGIRQNKVNVYMVPIK